MKNAPEKNRSSKAAVFCVDHKLLRLLSLFARDRFATYAWENVASFAMAVAAEYFADSALAVEDGDETKEALRGHADSFVGNYGLRKILAAKSTVSKIVCAININVNIWERQKAYKASMRFKWCYHFHKK